MIWNPFARLRETNSYPYARLIRSSFTGRIADTFKVFNGDILGKRMGILDYIYPFPRIMSYAILNISIPLNMYTTARQLYSGIILLLILAIPTIIVNIPKLIVSSALTLLVSPALVLAHLWFHPINKKYMSQIKDLRIRLFNQNMEKSLNILVDEKDLSEEKTLAEVLPPREFKYLSVRSFPKNSSDPYPEYAEEKCVSPRLGLFSIKSKDRIECRDLLGKPLALIQVTPQNKKPIKALLNTNMFWATQHLEASKVLPVLQDLISKMIP